MRIAVIALVAVLAVVPAGAQVRHHNFTLGGGGAIPGGDLTGYYSPTGFVRVGYGYRIARNFQADTGIDVGFRSAGVKDFYESQFGPLRIRDYQYMVPFGGRVILPFGEEERLRLHAGGGGAYLRYSERSTQPFANAGIRLECPVCNARSGWGYYGGAGANFGLTPGGRLRFGGTVNVYRATTDGQGVGLLPNGPSHDRWVNAAMELSFEF